MISESSYPTEIEVELINELVDDIAGALPPRFLNILRELNQRLSENGQLDGRKIEATILMLVKVLELREKKAELATLAELEGPPEASPRFEIEPDDRTRVLKLTHEMKELIANSRMIDDPHKKRLLARASAIETELYKPRGNFDVILGGVSDFGESLGKFGRDVKPLVDRMAEITRITRRGTAEYEQLPAPEENKRLPAPEEDEK